MMPMQWMWTIALTMLCTAACGMGQTDSDGQDLLEQSRALRRELMAQTASAVTEKTEQQEDAALNRLIEQVMSLKTPVRTDPNGPAQPTLAADQKAAPAKPTPVPAAVPAPGKQPAADPLKQLDGVTLVLYPVQLADVLYQAGSIEAAGRYYEQALKAVDLDNVNQHQWLLFQTANCLRKSDEPRAALLYEELLRRYPNSVWVSAAQARHNLLTWMDSRRQEVESRIAQNNANE